jgi:hypothetical protein
MIANNNLFTIFLLLARQFGLISQHGCSLVAGVSTRYFR